MKKLLTLAFLSLGLATATAFAVDVVQPTVPATQPVQSAPPAKSGKKHVKHHGKKHHKKKEPSSAN
jgi:opacity protein-like surface antigen